MRQPTWHEMHTVVWRVMGTTTVSTANPSAKRKSSLVTPSSLHRSTITGRVLASSARTRRASSGEAAKAGSRVGSHSCSGKKAR